MFGSRSFFASSIHILLKRKSMGVFQMSVYRPEGMLLDTPQNRMNFKNISALQEAFVSRKILEARAIACDCDHNLIVDLGVCRGIIPRRECVAHIDDSSTRDIAIISRVNKPVVFRVMGFDGETPVLSRREVQSECIENYVKKLCVGDVIDCRVTHLEKFGAFVDIGCGIASLLPIDMISISRISHPSDRFRVGDYIKAVVASIEPDTLRVTLSHKELLGTWEENASLFRAGETVAGIIRSVEPYGVFVELTPNLAGLAEPREDVYAGQHASVYINSLIPEKMKVKLIIVDAFDADYSSSPPNYFTDAKHIDCFRYSPECSSKVIETIF